MIFQDHSVKNTYTMASRILAAAIHAGSTARASNNECQFLATAHTNPTQAIAKNTHRVMGDPAIFFRSFNVLESLPYMDLAYRFVFEHPAIELTRHFDIGK